MPSSIRICTKCKEEKDADAFSKARGYKDGRRRQCKTCCSRSSNVWDKKNHAKVVEYRKTWRTKHPEYTLLARRWAENNPERYNELKRNAAHVRRVREKSQAETSFVSALVVLELDDGVCGICHTDVNPMKFELDHVIPVARGGRHAYDNVQVAHPECNRRKSSTLPWLN